MKSAPFFLMLAALLLIYLGATGNLATFLAAILSPSSVVKK